MISFHLLPGFRAFEEGAKGINYVHYSCGIIIYVQNSVIYQIPECPDINLVPANLVLYFSGKTSNERNAHIFQKVFNKGCSGKFREEKVRIFRYLERKARRGLCRSGYIEVQRISFKFSYS